MLSRRYPRLGMLSPSVDAIAKVLAGRDRLRIQPSAAYAANLLHLSEQVPAKALFLTDGPSRRVKVGNREIILKRTTPRAMAAAGRRSGLVIQGLKYLGQPHVTMERIAPLRTLLSDKDRAQLKQDMVLAPAWMRPFLQAIAEGKELLCRHFAVRREQTCKYDPAQKVTRPTELPSSHPSMRWLS